MEHPIQAGKEGRVLFVKMDEIGGSVYIECMTPLLEAASCSGLRVLLPRKDENDIPAFVTERHSIGKGILPRNPSNVDSQGLIRPRSRAVERLVAYALNHACQLLLRTFGRHTCDKTDDSRHIARSAQGPTT